MDKKLDAQTSVVTTGAKIGLPVIECRQAATPQEVLTADRVAEILLAQETEWHHAVGR